MGDDVGGRGCPGKGWSLSFLHGLCGTRMMKKYLSILLRIVVAVAGVAYIVWAVDWTDQIEMPAGTVVSDNWTLQADTRFKVISGDDDPSNPLGEFKIRIVDADGRVTPRTVLQSALNTGPDGGPRFVPGIITTLKQSRWGLLLAGLLVIGIIYPILLVRWWLLLRARDMYVPLWKAFRLVMVGNFFNFCMPGTTGGDVVKAYYAAKGSGRRAEAVMTVIVDRVCGLLGLLLLGGIVGLFMLGDEQARSVTIYTWLICLSFAVGCVVYFSQRLRAMLGLDWVLAKLPAQQIFASIDEAAFAYRNHKRLVLGAVAMSMVLHIAFVSSTSMAGYALGLETPIGVLLCVLPVTFLIGSIPIAPQGIGVMEVFAVTMLESSAAAPNQIIGMLIMIRLYQMFYSLLGSVFLLKGDIHLHPQSKALFAESDAGSQTLAPTG